MSPAPKTASPKKPWIVRNGLVFFIIVIICTLLLASSALIYLQWQEAEAARTEKVKFVYMARGEENKRIQDLISEGRFDDVIDFFAQYTGNRYNASAVILPALHKKVPVLMWFALVKTENWDFNPRAVSKSNENGTRDLGMGQGNSVTYADIPVEKMLDVDFNMDLLTDHIVALYEGRDPRSAKKVRSGGSWDDALLFYNTGPYPAEDRVKLASVHKLQNIYEWERLYGKAFWERFYAGG